MALIKKRDPLLTEEKDILSIQEKIARLFDEAVSRNRGCHGIASGAWVPSVDIYETAKAIVFCAEVPGVDMADLCVEVEGNTLVLTGIRRYSNCMSEEHHLRMERLYGSFRRAFNLPIAVDKECIKAVLKEGLLTITLPKSESHHTKQIEVREGD
ncbi:MAG: Hsp20/alpha crystallin family protein [Deltaproteobacteria bacterium]|nr:Hsp20/alpha crystallin family protein [Deltaproteobacteria bacterium]